MYTNKSYRNDIPPLMSKGGMIFFMLRYDIETNYRFNRILILISFAEG